MNWLGFQGHWVKGHMGSYGVLYETFVGMISDSMDLIKPDILTIKVLGSDLIFRQAEAYERSLRRLLSTICQMSSCQH